MLAIAWGVWAVTGNRRGMMVARDPGEELGHAGLPRGAAAWWSGREMYTDPENGYLYFPQSAILYTPFTWGPVVVGELLWRIVCLAVFATGLRRLMRALSAGIQSGRATWPLLEPLCPARAGRSSSRRSFVWPRPRATCATASSICRWRG